MTETERWAIGLAIGATATVITGVLSALWYLGSLWANAYNERQNKEFTVIHAGQADIRDSMKAIAHRLEEKYVSRETFDLRMGSQDREIANVKHEAAEIKKDLRTGFEGVYAALGGKVSKDTWQAATLPAVNEPAPVPRPRFGSRPGPTRGGGE